MPTIAERPPSTGLTYVEGANVRADLSWVTIGTGNPVAIHGVPKAVEWTHWLTFTIYFRGLGSGEAGRVDPDWVVDFAANVQPPPSVNYIEASVAGSEVGIFYGGIVAIGQGFQHRWTIIAQSPPYPVGSAAWSGVLSPTPVGPSNEQIFSLRVTKGGAPYWPVDGEYMQVKVEYK